MKLVELVDCLLLKPCKESFSGEKADSFSYDQTKFRNRYPRKPWFHPGTVPKPVGIDARVHMLTGFRQVEDGDTEAREFGAIATDHDKVINIDILRITIRSSTSIFGGLMFTGLVVTSITSIE